MEIDKDRIDELKQQAPFLASLERNHPFTVPADYFAESAANIVAQVKLVPVKPIQDSSLLQREHPFEIPEDYFENLTANIFTAIENEDGATELPIKVPVQRRKSINIKAWMAAASILAVVLLSATLLTSHQPGKAVIKEEANSIADAGNGSLLGNVSDIDEAALVEFVVRERMDESSQSQQESGKYTDEDGNDNYLLEISDIDQQMLDEI